jgi:hypothetical protein
MNQEQAIAIVVMLLNRLTLNQAEAYAVNEAVKVLAPQPPKPAQ